MLPLDLKERLVPPAGHLLVQRDERPLAVRGVVIPDRARQASRAAMATVLRVAPDVVELEPGDRVLLAATVGARKVVLGERGEWVAEVCKPSQILLRILDGEHLENRGEHALANVKSLPLASEREPFDEGDPLAIL